MSELARIFLGNQNKSNRTISHLPMINSLTTNYSSYLSTVGQTSKKKALMSWIKGIPELTALLSKVARDIVSKYHFEPIDPNDKGRNKILKANRFAMETSLRKIMYSQMIDALGLGEAFGWKGSITKEQIKETIDNALSKEILISATEKKELKELILKKILTESKNFQNGYFLENKTETGIINTTFSDEDLLRPRKYRYVPSSTVEIQYDQYDITGYNQIVGLDEAKFTPEEIIRFSLTELDGRINGFTPVESILIQLELLRQMWQNMLSIHKNGGAPDKLFILENTKVNTPEYQRIEEQLKKYKLVENKHGNLLFTGNVKVEDIAQLDKMQFMDSGLYITGLIAMQWQIPRSSIPYIVGGVNTKDDTGGNSDASYWSTVEYIQEIYAEQMNTQLWIPHFGVRIIFDNTHIQKDLRLETSKQMKLGNVATIQELLLKNKKQLKDVKLFKLLDLTDADVEEADMTMMLDANPSTMNNQLSKNQVNKGPGAENQSSAKRNSQNANAMRTGSPPNGVSKEEIDSIKLEVKSDLKEYFDSIVQEEKDKIKLAHIPKKKSYVIEQVDNNKTRIVED